MTLRARLLLLVVLAVLPAIGIEIEDEIELRAARQQEIRDEATRLMHLLVAEQTRIGEGTRQLLVAFAEASNLRSGRLDGCHEAAVRIRRQLDGYTHIGLVDPGGQVICSSADPVSASAFRSTDFVERVRSGDSLVASNFRVSLTTGKPVLTYGIPLRDDSGAFIGAAWASLDLVWLAEHYAPRFQTANMTLLIADREGTILVRLPDPERYVGKPIGNGWIDKVNAASEGVTEGRGIDGIDRVIAYSPAALAPKGFYLGVGLTKAPLFAAVNAATHRKAALISLGFLGTLLAAWFGGEAFIRKPIRGLLRATREWRQGDYSARTGLRRGNSEISRLALAFDEMAEALERREKDRRAAERALARLNAELETRVQQEVAEREKVQNALLQSQKIEAVGQLTSGVAHDFNNLLAAVLGNLELLRPRIQDPAAARLAEGAIRAAARGAKLTEQLLAFSRRRHLQPAAFDLNRMVNDMGELLTRTIGPGIQISRALAPDLWPALSDPSQIEIALLNLVLNARDAMPQGGSLVIQTMNLRAGDRRIPPEFAGEAAGDLSGDVAGARAGDFVMLVVRDSGVGMPAEIRERAFEPFFTTKEVGKGTGLGLSMIYGIVAQSGGWATIDSEPGKGTAVSLALPRAAAMPESVPPQSPGWSEDASAAARPARTGQGLHVLVVDDDHQVRQMTEEALAEHGYAAHPFQDGRSALTYLEAGNAADLVVLDYAMPGLRGDEVVHEIRKMRPLLPIVMISGFTDPDAIGNLPEEIQLVRKPFRISELLAAVEKAVSSGSESAGQSGGCL